MLVDMLAVQKTSCETNIEPELESSLYERRVHECISSCLLKLLPAYNVTVVLFVVCREDFLQTSLTTR